MPTINKYPVFEDNQVLTAGQLNSLASYLDEQTRISRTYLIGTGIVCGLQVTMLKPDNKIVISKGTGVTSEGFLISLGNCETTHFRPYEFPSGVAYPHFMSGPNSMYPMWELLTSQSAAEPDVKGLNEFADANWQNYVVVLFLEIYDKDLFSCLGKSCDEIGIDRILTVRKLLVAKTDLQAINAKQQAGLISPNTQDYRYLGQFDLEHLQMPRAILNTFTTKNTGQILYQYLAPIALVFDKLISNSTLAYQKFELLLNRSFTGNPFSIPSLTTRVNELRALYDDYLNGKYGFQYYYDFMVDLVMAYNEFCCAASHLKNQCIPDEKTFPLHLMLGEIACPLSPLRQHFVSSPIIGEQKEWNEKVTVLYKRLVAMLYAYDDELVALTAAKGILITPSREKGTRLGERAVPVYYNPAANPLGYTLYDVWDEETCLPCRMHHNALPGYHAQLSINQQLFPVSEAQTPLHYDINNHSFFRVEGHVGMDETAARQKIKDIARLYNLDFEVVTLFVGNNGTVESVKCVFSDLETDYAIWRNKMRFFLNNFIRLTKQAENFNGFIKAVQEELDKIKDNEQESDSDFRKSFPFKATMWMEAFSNFEAKEGEPPTSPDEEELMEHIRKLNQCLKSLIAAMPGDLEELDFEEWCNAYRCAPNRIVTVMIRIADKMNDELSPETRVAMMMVLYILHYFLEFLDFMLIRPYLTIATIQDTVVRRLEALKNEYSLSKTLDTNPGLEHMAGIYRGQTFVLIAPVTMSEVGDDSKLFNAGPNGNNTLQGVLETYNGLKAEGFYNGFAAANANKVIGDLSGYVCCCDPCADIDVDNYNVTPIAFPVTRILAPERKKQQAEKEGDTFYSAIKIQLLNNVYNPDEFEPVTDDEAQFGALSFEETEYLPEDDKKNKILIYTPDTEKIKQVFDAGKKYMLIDKFKYAFKNKITGATVSTEYIYIFISALSVMDIPEPTPKTGRLTGKILADMGNAPYPPEDSQLTFKIDNTIQPIDNNILSYSYYTGIYVWKNINSGAHNIEIGYSKFGQVQNKPVNIITGQEAELYFHFSEKENSGVLTGTITLETDGKKTQAPSGNLRFELDGKAITINNSNSLLKYTQENSAYFLTVDNDGAHTFKVTYATYPPQQLNFVVSNMNGVFIKDFNFLVPQAENVATINGTILAKMPGTREVVPPPKEMINIMVDGKTVTDFAYDKNTGAYVLKVNSGSKKVTVNVQGINDEQVIENNFTGDTVMTRAFQF